jgi:hypothetical protein
MPLLLPKVQRQINLKGYHADNRLMPRFPVTSAEKRVIGSTQLSVDRVL